jgi:hypothetical protein
MRSEADRSAPCIGGGPLRYGAHAIVDPDHGFADGLSQLMKYVEVHLNLGAGAVAVKFPMRKAV